MSGHPACLFANLLPICFLTRHFDLGRSYRPHTLFKIGNPAPGNETLIPDKENASSRRNPHPFVLHQGTKRRTSILTFGHRFLWKTPPPVFVPKRP